MYSQQAVSCFPSGCTSWEYERSSDGLPEFPIDSNDVLI